MKHTNLNIHCFSVLWQFGICKFANTNANAVVHQVKLLLEQWHNSQTRD